MGTREFNPFLFYSKQFQELLSEATKQQNPALWLFKHDARTCLFMLEALTRLHKQAYDKKIFVKWNNRFKKLEDLLGEIDKYAALEKELKGNKRISPEVLKYFSVHTNRYVTRFNQRLREKKWLEDKLQKFDKGIKKFDITYDKDHISLLKLAIKNEVNEILDFARKYEYTFTRLEEQVHELRRKIRWLSIYASCLKGLIQLKASSKKHTYHVHYFTKQVLSSPFNRLEPKPKNVTVAQFNKDSFFALSWLINELGILKDKIITLHELKDAIYVAEDVSEEKALAKAISILGLKKSAEKDVLKEASEKIRTVFEKDKILDHLLIA